MDLVESVKEYIECRKCRNVAEIDLFFAESDAEREKLQDKIIFVNGVLNELKENIINLAGSDIRNDFDGYMLQEENKYKISCDSIGECKLK